MKIELIMRDGNGVMAVLVGEGTFHALDAKDTRAVGERYCPNRVCQMRLTSDNGSYWTIPAHDMIEGPW